MTLYAPTRTYAGDNKPSAEGYILVEGGPWPCRFEIKQSTDLATVIGRLEGDQVETVDTIHSAADCPIDDNYWVKNVSVNLDGSESVLFGRWWVCRGQPQRFIQSARRQGGKVSIKASQEAKGPLGIED
jgi:hypothetical protein